ncbi:MAG: energy-coupling factor transporter ATPase [bacterium]|nr:energy-coupling factor transporter ATPase [bacterium]MDD5354348.1 energy-coupling factor transporter ATPase [bacterium]MDD5755794.1 energy-coupling factor transporter ATPase [bacterium]
MGTKKSREIINIEKASFTYRSALAPALKKIAFKVKPGEVIGIMGPTGAGKSTLGLLLNGIIPHFVPGILTGQVLIDGKDTAKLEPRELAGTVGVVFQDFETQLFTTSVELEVAFGPENLCLPVDTIRKRVHDYLDLVGLPGQEKKEPANLSGGEKQRLAIASILAMEPAVLYLDEPTTDLDPAGKKEILSLIRILQKKRNTTLLLVEHETEQILACDQVIILKAGEVITSGPAREVLCQNQAVEQLGIKPLQVSEVFADVPELERPLTLAEGIGYLKQQKYYCDENKYRSFIQHDQREYGPVLIELEKVGFSYGDVPALTDINFSVRKGEFIAILGQNGSSKTTLLKQLNGLLAPGQGIVRINGRDTKKHHPVTFSSEVGYVFQNPDHQIIMETVYDDVAFGLRFNKVPETDVQKRVQETLAAVGLTGLEKHDPFTLTKGQRQQVAVAAVLANRPDILVFDEPTTGLDYQELRRLMELINKLNQAGHTIIMVTHCMWIAAEYAQRVVIMDHGQIVVDGPTREIFTQADTLQACQLALPPVTLLAQQLGKTVLSVVEFKECFSRGNAT